LTNVDLELCMIQNSGPLQHSAGPHHLVEAVQGLLGCEAPEVANDPLCTCEKGHRWREGGADLWLK
jgi:hypothetical protein